MDNFDEIATYYDGLVQEFGHQPEACDYGSPESQHAKFQVLAEVQPLRGKSILDVGCGFADFADYLRIDQKDIDYTGIDLSSEMIEQASSRRPDLDLYQENILDVSGGGEYDIVFANGIFYLLKPNPWSTMKKIIDKMYDLCKEAVAFNSLSNRVDEQEPSEFYADPLETVEYCERVTPWITLRQDYHPRDFTIYMFTNQN